MSYFTAVSYYSLPLHVRCDRGRENIKVAQYMWSQPSWDSLWDRRSVHNQRIEHLWRDVFQGCTGLNYQLFHHLEGTGPLDPCNEIHLFATHYVYLPRIWRSLDHFHYISTTPSVHVVIILLHNFFSVVCAMPLQQVLNRDFRYAKIHCGLTIALADI